MIAAALLLALADPSSWADTLTDLQARQIIYAVCGPEGANDQIDWSLPREACERVDWNGVGYGKAGVDWNGEFFCDDFLQLDPARCGIEPPKPHKRKPKR